MDRQWSGEEIRLAMELYAVTDRTWLRGRSLAACVQEAIAGGVTFVQLREKDAPREEVVALGRMLAALCREADIPFVVNDDVDVALAVGADGVHVGQSDVACTDARAALGPNKIVGVSAQTLDQALAAQAAGADYLGVGALIPTATKPDAVDVTYDQLRQICHGVTIPVVGIGGLNAKTIPQFAGAGLAGVAVVSAIFAADDCEAAAKALKVEARKVIA